MFFFYGVMRQKKESRENTKHKTMGGARAHTHMFRRPINGTGIVDGLGMYTVIQREKKQELKKEKAKKGQGL